MAQQQQQPQRGIGGQQQPQSEYGGQRSYGQGPQSYAQPGLGTGQFAGQHPGATSLGQRVGQGYDQSVPREVQTAVRDLDRVASVAEWTKTKASERGMPRVVRVCDDIEDIAHLEKKLIIRQSPFAQPIGQASMQVIEQGLQELQQHISEPEVQETVASVQQSLNSIDQGLSKLQQVGQQQQFGQQMGGQQVGGQFQQPGMGTTQQSGQSSSTPQF